MYKAINPGSYISLYPQNKIIFSQPLLQLDRPFFLKSQTPPYIESCPPTPSDPSLNMSYYNQQQPPVGAPPPQGYPPEGYPKDGYPPPGYPPQGYPQGYPPQGYPPYPPPQGYPPPPPQYAQPPPPQQQQQNNSGPSCLEGCLAALCCCCLLDACF